MNNDIQEIPALEEFLQSLSLDRPNGEASPVFQIQFAPTRDGDQVSDGLVMSVWQDAVTSMKIETVRKKIASNLEQRSHSSSPQICDILLAALTVARIRRRGTAIGLLNEMLSQVTTSDLSMFFAFRIPGSVSYKFDLGKFKVGPLDLNALSYRSGKAGSDYAVRHADRLRNLPLSISSTASVRVIDWGIYARISDSQAANQEERFTMDRLIIEYFHCLAQVHFDQFFDDFREAQLFPQALVGGRLNVEALLRLSAAERVAIYSSIGGRRGGFVAPTTIGIQVDLGGSDKSIPYVTKTLKEKFGPMGKGALGGVTQRYVKFLADSAQLESDGNIADAFLYHVIALDLLLGEKDSSTASVTKRAAALTFTSLGRPYQDVRKDCDRIYNARSQYVHAGEQPDKALLEPVKKISREIALVLLRLQSTDAGSDDHFHKKWTSRVQVLVSKLEAGDPIADEELHRIGAATAGAFGYAQLDSGLEKL